jgi:hypothetical protein
LFRRDVFGRDEEKVLLTNEEKRDAIILDKVGYCGPEEAPFALAGNSRDYAFVGKTPRLWVSPLSLGVPLLSSNGAQ